MLGLVLEKDGTIGIIESITGTIADTLSDNIRPEITPPMIVSLPNDREKKILRLRRQIEYGTYDLDERLDAVLERILTDIIP